MIRRAHNCGTGVLKQSSSTTLSVRLGGIEPPPPAPKAGMMPFHYSLIAAGLSSLFQARVTCTSLSYRVTATSGRCPPCGGPFSRWAKPERAVRGSNPHIDAELPAASSLGYPRAQVGAPVTRGLRAVDSSYSRRREINPLGWIWQARPCHHIPPAGGTLVDLYLAWLARSPRPRNTGQGVPILISLVGRRAAIAASPVYLDWVRGFALESPFP